MIDPEGPVPLYRQVAEVIAGRIAEGKLVPNKPIPSEKQLQGEFGIARGTARRVVDVLRDEKKLVWTVSHRGTFVLPKERWGKGHQDEAESDT